MTVRYLDDGYRLGRNFSVGGLTASETADAHGVAIRVEKGSDVARNLRGLVVGVLQPLRDDVGEPVFVSSGYRPPDVNELVGGAPDSQHVAGEAADVYARGLSATELARRIVSLGLPYDQVIVEHDQGVVHVSHVHGRNRREALTRVDRGLGHEYVAGVLAEPDAIAALEGDDGC